MIDRYHDQKLSYVKTFSPLRLIQSRPDIDAIFAFDHHMALASIPVLPGTIPAPRPSVSTGSLHLGTFNMLTARNVFSKYGCSPTDFL